MIIHPECISLNIYRVVMLYMQYLLHSTSEFEIVSVMIEFISHMRIAMINHNLTISGK